MADVFPTMIVLLFVAGLVGRGAEFHYRQRIFRTGRKRTCPVQRAWLGWLACG